MIQKWINSNRKHYESHPIFENKDRFQPIIAKSPMNVCQTGMVIMEKHPSKGYNNKTYSYILNVMDVFSRCLFLTVFRVGFFGAAHGWGEGMGGKKVSPP